MTAIGVIAVMILASIAAIATKRTGERGERTRKKELMDVARAKGRVGTDIDALGFLYDLIIKQMYRFKHQSKPYEHLIHDANLIIELRNTAIENEVIREMDGGRAPSNGIPRGALSMMFGSVSLTRGSELIDEKMSANS